MTISKPNHHSCLTSSQAILRSSLKFAPLWPQLSSSHVTFYSNCKCQLDCSVHSISCQERYKLYADNVWVRQCSHTYVKILKVVESPYELYLLFKLRAIALTRSCVQAPKGIGTENPLCFSWGSASVHAVHYCSVFGHKTLIKALHKGNNP